VAAPRFHPPLSIKSTNNWRQLKSLSLVNVSIGHGRTDGRIAVTAGEDQRGVEHLMQRGVVLGTRVLWPRIIIWTGYELFWEPRTICARARARAVPSGFLRIGSAMKSS